MDNQFVTLLFSGLAGVTLLLGIVTGSSTLLYLTIPLAIIGIGTKLLQKKAKR